MRILPMPDKAEEAPRVFLSFFYSKNASRKRPKPTQTLVKQMFLQNTAVRPKSFAHNLLASQYQGGTWYAVLDRSKQGRYQQLTHGGIAVMIRVIVSIACCALIAPLAFADGPKQRTPTAAAPEQGITVTGTTIVAVDKCEAASYQPPNTLVVRNNADPHRYVLYGSGHVVNSKGERIGMAVRPGASVHVFFASTGGVKTIDHVVVD